MILIVQNLLILFTYSLTQSTRYFSFRLPTVTILILIVVTKMNGINYWELVNYQKEKTTPKQIISMVIVIVLVGMIGMYLAGFVCYGVIPYAAPMMIAPIPSWLAVINVIVLPITTAFAEEGLYLGCGVNHIKNKYIAIAAPAFFFALKTVKQSASHNVS